MIRIPVKRTEILCGDSLEWLQRLPDNYIQTVVTSSPYFGLRDYGLPNRIWDGDSECQHEWGELLPGFHPGQVEQTKWKDAEAAGKAGNSGSGKFCQKCSAWIGCLGLEPTPELYVFHLVEILREVKRTLRKDGTFWLVLGDSYVSHKPRKNAKHSLKRARKPTSFSRGRNCSTEKYFEIGFDICL
jgi:DNA modification methylase